MLFNSFAFAVFLPIAFLLYWFVFNANTKIQNVYLLIINYIFYGWWDWRFLVLLIGSSVLSFLIGMYMEKLGPANKKKLLYLGLLLGIGTLAFFKYFNFFISSVNDLLAFLNIRTGIGTLNLLLPLGISFYTLRILSYLLDIYRGKFKPTTDLVVFLGYVSFFPSIISGPIDKARSFIPQLQKKRVFDYSHAADGMRQILWGLFKKLVIADGCALAVNEIFSNYKTLSGSILLLGAVYFAFQIYADFSGYSDMAIGIARLFGFNLMRNFAYPYFSSNIAEFWRRWHISLTSWLTEYVFTPLTIYFRGYGKAGLILAILINFSIIGLWHGASWTFILFGFLNGCYFIPLILKGSAGKSKYVTQNKIPAQLRKGINIALTFLLITVTLVFFRADSIKQALDFIEHIIQPSLFSFPELYRSNMIWVIILVIAEWIQRHKQHALQIDVIKQPVLRWGIYSAICFAIYLFGGNQQPFIYFHF